MMTGLLVPLLVMAVARGAPPVARPAAPLRLNATEDLMFFGDSISCQWWGNYTTFVEAYLRSRLPGVRLAVYNASWPGETSRGALARFNRDVTPVHPSLVVVSFGMNDGIEYERRSAENLSMLEAYRTAMRGITQGVRRMGARGFVLTPTPADHRDGDHAPVDDPRIPEGWAPPERYITNHELDGYPQYNGTLAMFAAETMRLADGRDLRGIDLLNDMLPILGTMRRWPTRPSLTCDSIHPTVAGYLVMAYFFLRDIAAPRVAARVGFNGSDLVSATPGTVEAVTPAADGFTFRLRPAFLPLYVLPEARQALQLVPFEQELNAMTLQVRGWPHPAGGLLYCDDRLIARCKARDLDAGVDLAVLEGAGWSAQSRGLQAEILTVGRQYHDLWRASLPAEKERDKTDQVPPGALGDISPAPDGFSTFLRPIQPVTSAALRAYQARSRNLSRLAVPGTYHLALRDHDPLLNPADRPVRLEGWEGANPLLWFVVGGHGSVRAATNAPSQGTQSLRLAIDEAASSQTAVASACHPALDLTRATAIAVDLRVGAAGPVRVALTLGSDRHAGRTGETRTELSPGAWTTVTFPVAGVAWSRSEPAAAMLASVTEIGVAFTADGVRLLPERIDLDNLRVMK